MTEDKSPHWRDGKNARIEARDKARAEELAKEHKNKKSVLDNPTHWRYNKSKGISHGTTTAKDIAGMKEKEKPAKEEKKEGDQSPLPSFTEAGAKKLKRADQENLLKSRGVKFSSKDKESDLIKKIIKSNPQE